MAKQWTQKRRPVKRANDPVADQGTSDQASGEETIQVNDRYAGGGPPPEQDSEHDQHQTGG